MKKKTKTITTKKGQKGGQAIMAGAVGAVVGGMVGSAVGVALSDKKNRQKVGHVAKEVADYAVESMEETDVVSEPRLKTSKN